jgi:hypothetical protein
MRPLLLVLFLFIAALASAQTADTLVAGDSTITIEQQSSPDTTSAANYIQQFPTTSNNTYTIQGVIRDAATGEGVPFATVFFPGSPLGATADLDGNFNITVESLPGDTVKFGAIGYSTGHKLLNKNKHSYGFYIELSRSQNELKEFVFRGGEDPAVVLVKNIIAHKPRNNPDRTQNYSYEVYNKLEVDLERLSKEQFEKLPIPMMKKFSFIYDNLDTSSEQTPFLPFYFTETLSDFYFQREPKKQREFIKASQVKGFKNESVTRFLGSMYQNLNAYDNFIPVFEKSFVSPVSAQGLFYYKYRIKDTQSAYGHNIILVQYTPRRSGENCFYGDFWVVDSIYALQRVSMEVPKEANINWVQRVSLYQEFAPVMDSVWFCVKDKFIASFVAPYNVKFPGFIGRKTTSYQNILYDSQLITDVVNDKRYREDVIVSKDARQKGDEFWTTARHDTLTHNERAIYKMIDTLEQLPVFNTYKNMIKFFATGVKEFGPVELGPYWYVYSSNPYEGKRFRFSMGTTPKLFKDVYLSGYIAYGTKDDSIKYGGNALWLLNRKPRMYLYASYTHDLDRSTSYYDAVSSDNLFANFARKPGSPWILSFVDEKRIEFFKEYFSGFSHQLTLLNKDFTPYYPLPYAGVFVNDEGQPASHVASTEVNLRLRFAYKERFLEGNYLRASLGSSYPIIEARYGVGIKNFLGGNYDYRRVTASISDNIKIAPLGSLYVNIFAGKYYGMLPYPLLEVHPGNGFLYYNRNAFNMMNRFEFISDQYSGINVEHTIGGGIFNYIPVLKKAKLRQFWTAKLLYGSLGDANKNLNLNKGYAFRTLEGDPYAEIGTGVSNIFQIFRLDAVWRVSPGTLPNESKGRLFSLFGSIQFNF